VPTLSEIILGLCPEVASEFIALRGKFSTCFVYTLLIFFLAQLVAAKQQLRAAQDAAAGGPNKDHVRVACPDKCTNVQKAMGLWNDYELYSTITVSLLFFSCSVLQLNHVYYSLIFVIMLPLWSSTLKPLGHIKTQ